MSNGYWGKILRVNLDSRQITIDKHDDKFYRTYLGGRGVIAHYLLKEVPPGCDPLGPENIVVFAPGVLTGTAVPGTARSSVGAKSPLTNGYGEGEAGGDWGAKLKWAGYDGLVVSGRSQTPVYLWITDDTVEIRDAQPLWGRALFETQVAIRAEVGDPKATAAMIGPGGERLNRFACIGFGTHNYAGRSGLGAVMGSKNLKAVAVNGTKNIDVVDGDGVRAIARDRGQAAKASAMAVMGTSMLTQGLNDSGGLPTRNFQGGAFEGMSSISGNCMAERLTKKSWGCYACPTRCKQIVENTDKDLCVTQDYGGPEYETIASFGSNCGIDDIAAVAKANELCDQNGLDTISTGMMISGAMECAERGLLGEELLQGLDLRFGSVPGMLTLLDRIVKREGLGDILAEGPKGLEATLGPEAAACFLHVKGQPLPMHEPRFKAGMGVGYAISPTGAEHMHNIHDSVFGDETKPPFAEARSMGILNPLHPQTLGPEKARLWVYMTLNRSVNNSVLVCFFTPYTTEQKLDLINRVTGWDLSSWELIKSAERALTMTRAFNTWAGFSVEDDLLPDRFFEPLNSGALTGIAMDREQFFETRDFIYDMLGWDRESGAPKSWKLHELGLGWVVNQR